VSDGAPRGDAPDLLGQAIAHEAAGRLADAEACLDAFLETSPAQAEALHLKGVVAAGLGRTEEGARLIERAISAGPSHPRYLRNLCEIYRLLGRYDKALQAGLTSAAEAPDDALCHVNLSVLHYARGAPDAAIASAERALALDPTLPSAHFGLAEALLLTGDFARGWDAYEWRWRLPGVPPPTPLSELPAWDGAPLAGRLLLIADQGFGDGIQFSRYIPWAAGRCAEVVVAASPELRPLIAQLPGVAAVFERWDDAPACDAVCPLSGLPRLHGTRADTIPAESAYLRADPALAAAWKSRLGGLVAPGHRRIGLVWAGRPIHRNDANRSMRLADFAPFGALDGVTLVSLQMGDARDQIGGYFGRAPLVKLGGEIATLADTLAIVDGLDLVITVDTAAAHVAGASGKPVWILLPFAPDWRWRLDRPDTPWYPTARLFRQPKPQAWTDVVAAVAAALASHVSS
jgi:Flp pilus assembly protein TadD